MNGFVDVVFDDGPGANAGRFVEVEDEAGRSIRIGEWIDRGNGMWALRIPRRIIATGDPSLAAFGVDP